MEKRTLACILVASTAAWAQVAPQKRNDKPRINYVITDLGAGTATAITDSGLVAGYSSTGRGFVVRSSGSMQEIGTLGGSGAVPMAVDNAGRVTGYSFLSGNLAFHAFLFEHKKIYDIGTLGGESSGGSAINGSGWVTGGSGFTLQNGHSHAFLYRGEGPLEDLGTLGGPDSAGAAINNRGDVAGFADAPLARHAFLYRNGVMHDIGPGEARAINQSGWVTGVANSHAFLYRAGGPVLDLGTLGGDASTGFAISDSGRVTGGSDTATREFHAFLYSGAGPMTDLGTLGGAFSQGKAINNLGQVVGISAVKGSIYHPFLYSDGVMYDLSDFAPGWENLDVIGINDIGQIAGSGIVAGTYHAFRLDPLPE